MCHLTCTRVIGLVHHKLRIKNERTQPHNNVTGHTLFLLHIFIKITKIMIKTTEVINLALYIIMLNGTDNNECDVTGNSLSQSPPIESLLGFN